MLFTAEKLKKKKSLLLFNVMINAWSNYAYSVIINLWFLKLQVRDVFQSSHSIYDICQMCSLLLGQKGKFNFKFNRNIFIFCTIISILRNSYWSFIWWQKKNLIVVYLCQWMNRFVVACYRRFHYLRSCREH